MFGIKLNNKKFLSRKNFLNSVDNNKIWSKKLKIEDILKLLNKLKEKISKHDFELDNNFIMTGRRNCLKNMIFERLDNSNNKYEENVTESLFNLWEFASDEYDGNLNLASKELNLTLKETINMCEKYRKKNIICLQEKDIILEMIQKIENYIDERKQ